MAGVCGEMKSPSSSRCITSPFAGTRYTPPPSPSLTMTSPCPVNAMSPRALGRGPSIRRNNLVLPHACNEEALGPRIKIHVLCQKTGVRQEEGRRCERNRAAIRLHASLDFCEICIRAERGKIRRLCNQLGGLPHADVLFQLVERCTEVADLHFC